VQAAGINPYRYVPVHPALTSLREVIIYPQINRATSARTIHPPIAQLVFAGVGRLRGTANASASTPGTRSRSLVLRE
jgi:hypothetical protein